MSAPLHDGMFFKSPPDTSSIILLKLPNDAGYAETRIKDGVLQMRALAPVNEWEDVPDLDKEDDDLH